MLDAVDGVVTIVDRGRYTVLTNAGPTVMAVKARELGRRGLVVGDRVGLVGDASGTPDTLARIVRRDERASALRRTADDSDPAERVVVANAEQLASSWPPSPTPSPIRASSTVAWSRVSTRGWSRSWCSPRPISCRRTTCARSTSRSA